MERASGSKGRRRSRREIPRIPEDLAGWMNPEEFERNLDRLPPTEVHWSSCHVSGQVFAKLYTHRYRDTPREELLRMRDERNELILAAGGTPVSGTAPLDLEVEMLDNILEFHLLPPCGCPPLVGGANVGEA